MLSAARTRTVKCYGKKSSLTNCKVLGRNGVVEVLSWHLPRSTEQNKETPQSGYRCLSIHSNQIPPEEESRVLPRSQLLWLHRIDCKDLSPFPKNMFSPFSEQMRKPSVVEIDSDSG
jgi:hypothetical protein